MTAEKRTYLKRTGVGYDTDTDSNTDFVSAGLWACANILLGILLIQLYLARSIRRDCPGGILRNNRISEPGGISQQRVTKQNRLDETRNWLLGPRLWCW